MKKSFRLISFLTGSLMLMGGLLYSDEGTTSAASTVATPAPQAATVSPKKAKKTKKSVKDIWICPMGDYTGPKTSDGKCPKCGMDLLKQEKLPAKKSEEKKEEVKPSAKAESPKMVWVCPMGDFTGDKPGKCPNCGMDLVEKK